MEKFSVLISVYKREQGESFKGALHSIFQQTIPPSEVVLVKDGPLTDELENVIADFVKQYDTLKVVALSENKGLGNALNMGLNACTNDLVARMDSDDLSLSIRFETQLRVFERDPEVSVVGGWITEFEDNPDQIIAYRKVPESDSELKNFFKSRNPLNHVTVMFRKKDVLEAGGYQHFHLFEDYWLWARMIKNGVKFYNVQNVLVNVRGGVAMAARRGGWKYVKSAVKFQWRIWKMGLISVGQLLKNIFIRFCVYMMPNELRSWIYKNILR